MVVLMSVLDVVVGQGKYAQPLLRGYSGSTQKHSSGKLAHREYGNTFCAVQGGIVV